MLTRYSEPWLRILYSPDNGGGDGGSGTGGDGGEGNGGGGGTGGNSGGGTTPTTYSEDYVRALRQESASYRTRNKALEGTVRAALGLKDGDDLPGDIAGAFSGRVTAAQGEATKTVDKARGALLKATFIAAAAGQVADVNDAFALAGALLGKVEVDIETGEVKLPPGEDGKPRAMADAVADLLKAKPYLKLNQTPGKSGGDFTGTDTGDVNPWAKETFNLTKQGEILKSNPEKAAQLQAAAKKK